MEKKNFKILVVDDEPAIVDLFDRWLGFEYKVTGFSNSWKALQAFKNEGYHLVITDIMMDQVDGFEFLKAVQLLKPHVNTIVITAHKSLSNAVRSQQHGADYMFFKPLELEEIQKAVETLYKRYCYWIDLISNLS
ncbi:response regulator [Deltaproteobacteria bacterium TL4]